MMRLRFQLVIAFLLLAIVPLTVIVGYSYRSSLQATRQAVREEGEAMTREMDERLVEIREELRSRLAALSAFPFRSLALESQRDRPPDDALLARLAASMGETAPLVEAFEFYPRPSESGGDGESRGTEQGAPPPTTPEIEPPSAPPSPRPVLISMDRILAQVEQASGQGLTEAERREMEKGLRASAAVVRVFTDPDVLGGLMRGEVDPERLEGRLEDLERQLEEDPPPASENGDTGRESRAAVEDRRETPKLPRVAPDDEGEPALRGASLDWLGEDLELPVLEDGEVVGSFRALLSGEEILARVLEETTGGEEEIAFAVDPDGEVYATGPEKETEIRRRLAEKEGELAEAEQVGDWMVVTSKDPETGLIFGIARPIRGSIEEMQRAAARNLGWGLSVTLLAMLAILPLSRRLTSRLETVTRGADRIAKGDLTARVPISSPREVGKLAESFNHMAEELSQQRERLLREERRRREQELREQRLELEYQRKKEELEEARRFQLSLLPDSLPDPPGFDLGVHTETATEVGGDYYDFRRTDDALVVAMGDATGHGARAGTMVTVVKGLFAAFPVVDDLAGFLTRASETVRSMGLARMRMAFSLARFAGDEVRIASGGMPPALVRRTDGTVEEINLPGMPLGGLPYPYRELRIELTSGEAILLMSDGLAELSDAAGEPFGYERIRETLSRSAAEDPRSLLSELVEAGRRWAGEGSPPDDVTLMVVWRS
ncbi:MAG: SpoIIE family protein phosphatase [Thermoanaerobaculia bacterium]|nr:SpoIIE family protein phosphatase [Thermoanaerobaculia bacterium]